LGILVIKKDLTGIKNMLKNNWLLFFISSFFAWGISNIVYFIGVGFTQANTASTIYTTYPIWITIYSMLLLHERSNLKLKFIGIVIGLIGVILLMSDITTLYSPEFLFGNILVLSSSIIWGLYSVLGKKIQNNETEGTSDIELKFTMVSSFIAASPVFIVLVLSPEFPVFVSGYPLESWVWILFMGAISTGLGLYLFFYGLKHVVEVSKGISLAFLKPIFATILAFIMLSEIPSITLVISICLVVVSILLINRNPDN
jgi:drug/metabolite transporter (DMT)-like permease